MLSRIIAIWWHSDKAQLISRIKIWDKIQDKMICVEYQSTVHQESILTESCKVRTLAAQLCSSSTISTMAITKMMFKKVEELCLGANKSLIRHLLKSPTIEVLKFITNTRWVHLSSWVPRRKGTFSAPQRAFPQSLRRRKHMIFANLR